MIIALWIASHLYDPFSDQGGCVKIHRSACNVPQLSRRDKAFIDYSEGRSLDLHQMIQYGSISGTFQIEIAVVRQVDGCGPVGDGKVMDHELIAVRQTIFDLHLQVARKSFFTVTAEVMKPQANGG